MDNADKKLLDKFLESNFDLRFFEIDRVSDVRVKITDKKGQHMTLVVRDGVIKNGGNRYYRLAPNNVWYSYRK
ncbi:hypothetical protein [Pectinatus haikarae]|uniref:Uncharacterized protein n=1 Tax=Pectinatus haikarae TaxID=349096 RepID=A0ABT9Y5P4_9FIRM|nr:hypothetical protein [Pectinatus haikarae]MDQ0202876.1 hypothetical protein [Pectinatus haikarae]